MGWRFGIGFFGGGGGVEETASLGEGVMDVTDVSEVGVLMMDSSMLDPPLGAQSAIQDKDKNYTAIVWNFYTKQIIFLGYAHRYDPVESV